MNEAQRSLRPPSSTTVCPRPHPLVLAAVRPVRRRVTCATRQLSGRGGAPSLDRRVQNQTGREVRSGPSSAHAERNPVGRRPCIEIEVAQGRGHGHRQRLPPRRARPHREGRASRVNAVLALRDAVPLTTPDLPSLDEPAPTTPSVDSTPASTIRNSGGVGVAPGHAQGVGRAAAGRATPAARPPRRRGLDPAAGSWVRNGWVEAHCALAEAAPEARSRRRSSRRARATRGRRRD